MNLEGLIIGMTLLIIVILWNAAPLLQPQRRNNAASTQKQGDRLLVHYEAALNNIRDLDEDYATGKIQSDDYSQEREQLAQRGIQILMALDALGNKEPASPKVEDKTDAEIQHAVDRQIEAAVAAYRSKSGTQTVKL